MDSDRALRRGKPDPPRAAELERDDSAAEIRRHGVADALGVAAAPGAEGIRIEVQFRRG
jgi:hypothetical protein